jgi:hypothetical protein
VYQGSAFTVRTAPLRANLVGDEAAVSPPFCVGRDTYCSHHSLSGERATSIVANPTAGQDIFRFYPSRLEADTADVESLRTAPAAELTDVSALLNIIVAEITNTEVSFEPAEGAKEDGDKRRG